jgi:hypothetical protein
LLEFLVDLSALVGKQRRVRRLERKQGVFKVKSNNGSNVNMLLEGKG